MTALRSVRTHYAGTWFASTLEADWAATFDYLDWYWQYEPVAVKLPTGENYRPDFYLPSQRVWCEVKGPHNERIAKPELLQQAVGYDEWEWASDLVVVLRAPGPGETAQWHGTRNDQDIVIVQCPQCEHFGFMDYAGIWTCRRHMGARSVNKFWNEPGGGFYLPGDLPMMRAPRPGRKGA